MQKFELASAACKFARVSIENRMQSTYTPTEIGEN